MSLMNNARDRSVPRAGSKSKQTKAAAITLPAAKTVMPAKDVLSERCAERFNALRISFLTGGFQSCSATDGAHLFSKLAICACLQALAESPELFPRTDTKRTFFDLGCSAGRPVLALAERGWRSFGVDLHRPAIKEAELNIRRAISSKFIAADSEIKVAHGNFFPRSFHAERLADGNEDMRSNYLQQISKSVPRWDDVSTQLGVSYDQVDLFYHYQVERLDNIIKFFSEFARPGAVLIFVHSFFAEPPEFPKNLRFIGATDVKPREPNPIVVFQKAPDSQ